ncbi:hypothetical protein AS594_33835 [Streptomyces agglomeratus]|uniref:Glycosyltransferase RgtA/B/C/D-like domain-containing protein n=1 Tax=Streptomyces agglomeratus TaxID=285458 RepID=A0A1E5PGM0_9ACTN|nr:hypothetical protein AS594_33835 [Streptomyces agglomeratus]OEJ49775.1 hypothetical protein BGK72_02245 [Streptomyces agglomeratus]
MRPIRRLRSKVADRPLWAWALAAVVACCGMGTYLVFSPGFLSGDSISQLEQALGTQPMHDWHPPVMALLWRALIDVTGTPAAMAALQSAVLWAALWVVAWRVWARTGNRAGSLAVLAIGLAPHIMNFTGVVWKDVHMAFALLAACAIVFVAQSLPADRSRTRWVLLVLGVLFIGYAILVRKNALLAGIPVFILLVRAMWPAPGRRRWLISTGALVAVIAVMSTVVSVVAKPAETRQYAQVMLDDLVHVLPVEEVRKAAGEAATTPDFQNNMVTTTQRCMAQGTRKEKLSDAYFECYPRDLALGPLADYADQLTSMWLSEIPRHLPQYAEYRLQVFTHQLFQGRYQFQNSRMDVPGIDAPDVRRKAMLSYYVLGSYRDMPLLFAGWFWLAVGFVMAIWPGRGPFRMLVRAMGISSVLYILGYLPTSPASDYRYVYWPALAGTLCLLLVWLGRTRTPLAAVPDPAPADREQPRGSKQAGADAGDDAGAGAGDDARSVQPAG